MSEFDREGSAGGAGAPDERPGMNGGRLEHPARPIGEVRDAPAGQPRIAVSHRCASIGITGSGKSTIFAHLFAVFRGQRLLVDVNDACELGPAATVKDAGGYCYAESVREIDWRARTVHFVPRAQNERAYNDLYAAVFERGNMLVWLDESFGPTEPNKVPRWLRTVVTLGRKRNLLHLAAMQEPMNVAPVLYTQAEHVFLFRLSGRPDELGRLAPRFGLRPDELQRELASLPEFGYLRHTIGHEQVWRMPPLPAGLVEHARGHVRFV